MGLPYYLETYGCQMNEYDSLIAQTILKNSDNIKVNTPADAKLIIINTCSVRENAHQKIYNRLQSLKHLHRKGARIVIMGCMAQSLGKDLLTKNLPVDFVIGPDELRNLGNLGERQAFVETSRTETYEDIIPAIDLHSPLEKESLSANVAIQRGCNNFCTFCVVPFTRGRERSRPVSSIIKEVQALADCGMKTVVLLGQNVNSYQYENTGFTELVKILLKETNIPRIYYTSPHPRDFPEELIDLTVTEERLGSQVHIPLQAGSDAVLERMRRDYTRSEFVNLVKSFQKKIKDVSVSTDIIVGFPGETEAQFNETLEVMEECRFDFAYMFAYSEREHTYARQHFRDDISAEVKSERLDKIIKKQHEIAQNINQSYVNKIYSIQVESISKKDNTEIVGTMRNGKKVITPVPAGLFFESMLGKNYNVLVTSGGIQTLRGILQLG